MTTWTNWGGNVTARPERVVACRTAQDVADAVRAAARDGLTVKAAGAGHSFSDIAATSGVVLDLTGLTGIVAVADDGRVRVRAGTGLRTLNAMLAERGLAMENLGDIDAQTVAGAVATGTHGTGGRFTGLAARVRAMQIVLADGSVVEASPTERPELFEAARVGLGAFGVVTELELACVPAFHLEAHEAPMRLDDALADLDDLVDGTDHFEMFWFPGADTVATKRNRRVAPAQATGAPLSPLRAYLEDDLLANTFFEGACRVASLLPSTTGPINRVSAKALGTRSFTDRSDRVFASVRRVRFVESEYAVPREAAREVLAELRAWFTDGRENITPFPLEIRFAAPDDVWLSTGYERANVYIAAHQYHRIDHRPLLRAVERIVSRYDGRPHWGKWHTLGADRLGELYPRLADARRVRDDVDPGRLFTNPYLERVLG